MSDMLKPELQWIEGRCYRVNDPSTEVSSLQEHDLYESGTNYNEEVSDEEDDFEVTMVDNSRYATTFRVAKQYIGYIIGRKGATRMRIEKETNTNIKIPKQEVEGTGAGDISILGPTAASVKSARRRINIIVISSRAKQRPTHFISIPMNTPEIMSNFESFKEQVLKNPIRGIEECIFMRTEKLHLTVGVMCLMDNEERRVASKLLTEAKTKIVMPLLQAHSPLKIRVKGLSYMNDDPQQIDVLYASVLVENGETGVLQTLADRLVDHFYKAGFMDKSHDNINHVKLHVTLINSRYRTPSGDMRKKRESFDGSDILERYASLDFGVVELNQLHLSQCNSAGDDGYYQPTCIISCREE